MKALALAWIVTFCQLTAIYPSLARADGTVRTFSRPPDQPKVSGFAEVRYHVKMSRPVTCEFVNRTRIWFDGKERYRIELLGIVKHKPSPVVVMLRLGNHVYTSSPIYRDPKRKEDWWGGPESCMPGSLETFLTPGAIKMRNSRLLGVESVLGLRA